MSELVDLTKITKLRSVLSELIYTITHLSPEDVDGSHHCRISKTLLTQAQEVLAETEFTTVIGTNPLTGVDKTSPRPWSYNSKWPSPGHQEDPSAILDANGNDVLPTSEWLTARAADIKLIVAAVNAFSAYNPPNDQKGIS